MLSTVVLKSQSKDDGREENTGADIGAAAAAFLYAADTDAHGVGQSAGCGDDGGAVASG